MTLVNTLQFWWNLLVQALKTRRKNFPCLISDFAWLKGTFLLISCQRSSNNFNNQAWTPPTSRYIESWCVWLNSNPLPSYTIESSGNVAILKSWKLLSLNSEWDLKFYILDMKSNEVGTTLKHPETIIVDVKNLSKSDILLIFHFLSFYFKKLKLPLNITDFNMTSTKLVNF